MKFIIQSLYLLTISILLFACCEDEVIEPDTTTPTTKDTTDIIDTTEPFKKIDVVTGMDLFDVNANAIGRWRSPNSNPSDAVVYPNPSIGTVSIQSLTNISRIWLIPATCFHDTATVDIIGLSQDLTYSIRALDQVKIKTATNINTNTIALDCSDVTTGFYRLFYQLETNEIHWRNLYIDPTVRTIPDFTVLETFCN